MILKPKWLSGTDLISLLWILNSWLFGEMLPISCKTNWVLLCSKSWSYHLVVILFLILFKRPIAFIAIILSKYYFMLPTPRIKITHRSIIIQGTIYILIFILSWTFHENRETFDTQWILYCPWYKRPTRFRSRINTKLPLGEHQQACLEQKMNSYF